MPGIKIPRSAFKGEVALEQFCCVSCKLVLKEPVQAPCGHRLCKSCADEIIGSRQPTIPRCPECEEEFEQEDGAQVINLFYTNTKLIIIIIHGLRYTVL